MVILTDHKPLQFALTQSKLQKGKANGAADYLNRPPITLLSTVMSMQGYDTTNWPQLYSVDCDFFAIFRQIYADTLSTTDYFLKDTFLYKLGQLCVPTGEHRHKLIWDAHYSKIAGHFGVAKTLVTL